MNQLKATSLFLIGTILVISGCSSTPKNYHVPTDYPTTVSPWPNEKNELAVSVKFFQPITISDYSNIVVSPANASEVIFNLFSNNKPAGPDAEKEKDGREIIAFFDDKYFERLSDSKKKIGIPIKKGNSSESGLLLNTKLLVIDSGYEKKFFSNTKTLLRIEVSLLDGKTGQPVVLAIFEDFGGRGRSIGLLMDSIEKIADDKLSPLISLMAKKKITIK